MKFGRIQYLFDEERLIYGQTAVAQKRELEKILIIERNFYKKPKEGQIRLL